MCDDASSSSSLLCSSSDVTDYERLDAENKSKKLSEAVDSIISIDSGECSDHEIISFHRQRREVDYKKLHDVSSANQCVCCVNSFSCRIGFSFHFLLDYFFFFSTFVLLLYWCTYHYA